MVLPFVKRLKRWVAEKMQKNSASMKRLRHKSMGDLETTISKNLSKGLSQGFQKEINEFQQTEDFRSRTNTSVTRNANNGSNGNKKDKKGNFKRKLFTNSSFANQQNQAASKIINNPDGLCGFDFMAKSWMNFKFDKKAIWESMT